MVVVGKGEEKFLLTSCKSRVDACAKGSLAFLAIAAATVGDVERHDDTVALLKERNSAAEFFDYAHVFVA